jgi:hypothetical protein
MAALRTQPVVNGVLALKSLEKRVSSSSYVYYNLQLLTGSITVVASSHAAAVVGKGLAASVQYPTPFFRSFPVSLNKVCPPPDSHFTPLLLYYYPALYFPSMAAFRAAGLQAGLGCPVSETGETEAAYGAMLHRI